MVYSKSARSKTFSTIISTMLNASIVLSLVSSLLLLPPIEKASADISTGLIGHWKFDNTTDDASGQGNHGTAQGGPTYTTGKINQALSFDGVDDYITLGTPTNLNFNSSASTFTLSGWVNRTVPSAGSSVSTVIGKYSAANGRQYLLGFNSSGAAVLLLSTSGSSATLTLTTSATFNTGTWVHVAATVDIGNDIYKIYVNGVEQASSASLSGALFNSTSQVLIAATKEGTQDKLTGFLDDLRVYNRALSSTDIQELYTYTGADTQNPTVSITAPTDGTTVADTVTFSASASDNVGVTQVEFFVDGVSKGTDTSSPYSINWDTTNGGTHACNGPHTHTLTATARDQAGNTGNATQITVYMNNPSYCSSGDITTGLIGHWTFDNTAQDSAGSNHGTLVGGPTYTTGKIGQAINLGGLNDYIEIGNGSILGNTTTKTVGSWIYLTTSSPRDAIFGEFSSDGSNTRNYLHVSSARTLSFDQYPPSGGTLTSASSVALGTWAHVIYVQNGSNRKIYINGTLSVEDNSAETYSGTAPAVSRIGYRGSASADEYDGYIDDLRIYNRALIQEDIDALYAYSGGTTTTYQCSDGIDNDGDGLTDYPNDPGCTGTTDNDEFNSASDTTPPLTPTMNTPNIVSSSQIDLSWSASSDASGIANYELYRCTGSSCTPTTLIAQPAGTTYANTGLSASTAYSYRVRAKDNAGNLSSYSNIVSATTQAEVTGPTIWVATNGSNNSSCGSSSSPCRTITYAYGKAVAGDTVMVKAGVYSSEIEPNFGNGLFLNKNGNSSNPITIQSESKHGAVIDPNDTQRNTVRISGSYNILRGFGIRDSGQICVVVQGSNNIIEDNEIYYCGTQADQLSSLGLGSGIDEDGNNNIYRRNYIHNAGRPICAGNPTYCNLDHGIYSRSANVQIIGNIFEENSARGIQLFDGSSGQQLIQSMKIYNNTVVRNGRSGILVNQPVSGTVEIKNNISYNNGVDHGGAGIDINRYCDGGNVVASNNVAFGNGSENLLINTDATCNFTNSSFITSDPSFVDPNNQDYQLNSSSPAIDAGLPLTAATPDFNGITRPQPAGGAYDIGAYEFVGAGSDTTAPVRSNGQINGQPSGATLPAGTTSATLSLDSIVIFI